MWEEYHSWVLYHYIYRSPRYRGSEIIPKDKEKEDNCLLQYCLASICVCVFFKIEFHYITLADLEFNMQTRLASSSQRSFCSSLPNVEIKGLCHHTRLNIVLITRKDSLLISLYILMTFFPELLL